jgi:hypothetical protein
MNFDNLNTKNKVMGWPSVVSLSTVFISLSSEMKYVFMSLPQLRRLVTYSVWIAWKCSNVDVGSMGYFI